MYKELIQIAESFEDVFLKKNGSKTTQTVTPTPTGGVTIQKVNVP